MTELLAVLISIFVVYVLYEIFKTVSESDHAPAETVAGISTMPPTAAIPQAEPAAPSPEPAAPAAATEAPRSASSVADPGKAVNLRNPVTGEVSPVPGNYRFAKKWIKEAMVVEGLLNKVYKNSELTVAVSPKVKEAIEQFKKLEKYQA